MYLNTIETNDITEWTQEELQEFQGILQEEVDPSICLEETEEILTRLYNCFVMIMDQ